MSDAKNWSIWSLKNNNHLKLINAEVAHKEGFTGGGLTLGIGGEDTRMALDLTKDDLSVSWNAMHVSKVMYMAAGRPTRLSPGGPNEWAPGGVAPDAKIANACDSGNCLTPRFGVLDPSIKVINNSWVSYNLDKRPRAQELYLRSQGEYVKHGVLIVRALDNDNKHPTKESLAAFPSMKPEYAFLEKGWLTVTGVDNSDSKLPHAGGQVCAVTKRYCLAAPIWVLTPDQRADRKPEGPIWMSHGTSFAAPQVSGTALLVWQAFPYFNNDLVRQTLLGTAKDLGAPGPDPI
ncbi:MAG: S8 family serine peptidase, partial [Ostreibacterium sp.]